MQALLSRLFQGTQVASLAGLLALFWFTPLPYKLFIMMPFVIPPLWYAVTRLIEVDDWSGARAEAAERQWIRRDLERYQHALGGL